MNAFRIIFTALVIFLVAVQLVHTPRNESSRRSPNDLFAIHPAPALVENAIRESCYDCHSDNTRYLWYDQIQPAAWWVGRHITEGKDHLNFSDFGRYEPKRAARKLEESYEEIDGNDMPLWSYRMMHPAARLNSDVKKQVLAWLDSTQEQIEPDVAK